MEFSTKEDIEAPLDRVFAEVTDFEHLERQVMRRGIDVRRVSGDPATPSEGLSWSAGFRFRGKGRKAEIALSEYDAPNTICYHTVSGGIEAMTRIDFVALSRARTRVGMRIELLPKTLSARLAVQSMKLAKGNMEKRFRVKMAEYAKDLEDRLKREG
ncbi:SRPBCC family protein [Salipiger sp. P9]|uniref:SRPBCC family protein n=1 Tax=Salipiger pentaromativorans TaxID=2943193 RepID=UPI0021572A5C|nr:SRPBCC family protein [Salipiger pentaromativorans]MCR8546747.1 SRPBCC family protein [Salipiger pentaromativorans]